MAEGWAGNSSRERVAPPVDQFDLREVIRIWRAIVERNEQHLASRDPDLIFLGETITLPPG